MAAAEKLSAKEAAIEVGTDPRTLRKFLRSEDCPFDPVGQGNRYQFTKGEVKKLKKLFIEWSGGTSKKKATKAEKVIEADDEEDVEEIDLDDDIEDQDEVDATTEEVDLDDDDLPVELDEVTDLEDLEGPDDEDLDDIEIEDLDD